MINYSSKKKKKKSQIGLKNKQHVYFKAIIIKAKEIKAGEKDWEKIKERFKAF